MGRRETFPGAKRAGHEAKQPRPSIAEIKNESSHTSKSPHAFTLYTRPSLPFTSFILLNERIYIKFMDKSFFLFRNFNAPSFSYFDSSYENILKTFYKLLPSYKSVPVQSEYYVDVTSDAARFLGAWGESTQWPPSKGN
jgi:hypothetical protein